jgi:chromosomal replication initiation ATPase DnaA
MNRATIARCVDLYDRLRTRVGSAAAMEQAIEYAVEASKRHAIAAFASGIDPQAVALIEGVAQAHGHTLGALKTGHRYTWVVPVRDEAVYVARAVTGVSFPVLGRYFGKDSSSLVFGQRRFERRLAVDELLRLRVGRVVDAAKAAGEAREGVAV